MGKTNRIDRDECRHVNVKDQDTWAVEEHFGGKGPGHANIILGMNVYPGSGASPGVLTLYAVSLKQIVDLRDLLDQFLEAQAVIQRDGR